MQIENSELQRLVRTKRTPFLAIDTRIVEDKYLQIVRLFPEAQVYYAVKANPHPTILDTLHKLGAGFEIGSLGELAIIAKLGIPSSKLISGNPIKVPAFVKSAHERKITVFALDSHAEVEKLSLLAPGCSVYCRLSVSNEGSEWPLERKFGVEIEEAIELLLESKSRGLDPYGVTFHVGSQCTNPATWSKAIEKSRLLWDLAGRECIHLRSIDIGGGFPSRYLKPVPSIDRVAHVIIKSLKENFPHEVAVALEPGRALVGEAGILVASIVAKAKRGGQSWLYIDVGVFNGLMEAVGGIKYQVFAMRDGVLKKHVLAGPSCDGMDVIANEVDLPELEIGDTVYIMSAGAYTTAYASKFDGFSIPATYLL